MICSKNCGTVQALRDHVQTEHTDKVLSSLPTSKSQQDLSSIVPKLSTDSNLNLKSPSTTRQNNNDDKDRSSDTKCIENQINKSGSSDVSEDPQDLSPTDHSEEDGRIEQSSKLISNLLGTQPDVIDDILTSKSTADAAKLLGVR